MSEPMTPDEFATWQDDMRSCRGPSEEEIRADERRKVAEEIAAEIERVVISGDFERPKYERGGFLNDARAECEVADLATTLARGTLEPPQELLDEEETRRHVEP